MTNCRKFLLMSILVRCRSNCRLLMFSFSSAAITVQRDAAEVQEQTGAIEKESIASAMISFATRLVHIRVKHVVSGRAITAMLQLVRGVFYPWLPDTLREAFPQSYDSALELLKSSVRQHRKVDICLWGCMLFEGDDIALQRCSVCGFQRFNQRRRSNRSIWQALIHLPIFEPHNVHVS